VVQLREKLEKKGSEVQKKDSKIQQKKSEAALRSKHNAFEEVQECLTDDLN